jgi:hypothetical protein
MNGTVNLSIHNAAGRLRIVMLEPWGREFLLTLNQRIEIAARPGPEGAGLRMVESTNRTVVFVEGCSGVHVTHGGLIHDLDQEAIVRETERRVLPNRGSADPMWDWDLDANSQGRRA